jgi:MFS family permease
MATGGYARALGAAGAKRLLASSVLARLPLGMSLAILLLVRETTGSFAAAGAVVGAYGLAGAAGGPLLGRLVDRFGPPPVLTAAALAQAAALTAIVAAARGGAGPLVLTVMGAAGGACIPPVSACLRALWPRLVPDPAARESAFALDATVQEVIWMAGPLLVGLLVSIGSPDIAVIGMAVVTLGGTAWFARAPLTRGWAPVDRDGAQVLRTPGMVVVLASCIAAGMTMGSLEVGLPGLAAQLRDPGITPALLALASTGSFLGGLAYGARSWTLPLSRRYALLLGAAALLMAPLLFADSASAALVFALTSGLGYAPVLSAIYALVGALAPAGAVTEAFTWCNAALGTGVAAGVSAGGSLIDLGGARAAFGLGIATSLAAALIWMAGRRRAWHDGAMHDTDRRLTAQCPARATD